MRQGKNATQVLARAVQGDKSCALVQACFGIARTSKIRVENHDRHDMSIPTKAKFLPQIPKVTPKFLRHLDLAMDDGRLPFTGSKKSHIHGWMRFSKPRQKSLMLI
ncbi:MAG: acyl-CoA thioesterase [Paraglaciecola sp.]